MSIRPRWSKTPSSKLGLLSLAVSLLAGTGRVAGVGELPNSMIADGIIGYLSNAHRGQPLNGGQGRGNNARLRRAAKRRRKQRARAAK